MSMGIQLGDSDSGYSPPIAIELIIHGQRFDVASVGPDRAILRDARALNAGLGIIRLTVDAHVTVYQVDLTQGIDPARTEQPFMLIGVESEVAA
jgi:hypothetical protein